MKEYNLNEIESMQEKALARVHDMQLKAKLTAEQADAELNTPKKETADAYRDNFYNAVKATPKTNHIRMPVELPQQKSYESFHDYFEPENKRIAEEKQISTKANLLDDVLKEPDKALLFALLLLMQSDKADEELMMSLLYIML